MDRKKDVVLLTDPGCDVDDPIVIAHAALSPRLRLRGIITTHAPNLGANPNVLDTIEADGTPIPSAEITRRVARSVLDRLPVRRSLPLYAGSSIALADRHTALMNDGVHFLLDIASRYNARRRLNVLAIGAATDLASALITDPSLSGRIRVLAMAFNQWPEGGDPFNVANDVIAWQQPPSIASLTMFSGTLIDSATPIVVADHAVCRRHLAVDAHWARQLANTGDLGSRLALPVVCWIEKLPDLCRATTGAAAWPIWDEALTAHLLGMT